MLLYSMKICTDGLDLGGGMAESIKQMSRGELEKLAEKTVKQRAKQRERQSKIREQRRADGLRQYTFWGPAAVPGMAPILIFAEQETAAQMRKAMEKEKRVFEMKNEMYYDYANETDKKNGNATAIRLNVVR